MVAFYGSPTQVWIVLNKNLKEFLDIELRLRHHIPAVELHLGHWRYKTVIFYFNL